MSQKYILPLTLIIVVIYVLSIFSPFLIGGDSITYFIIAKNMVLNDHWLWLVNSDGPWLDKPHLPFWLTAFSFKLFGFHPWSYLLPGAIFYLLGAMYTYKLALLLYNNKGTAELACLMYVTTAALMGCSLDLKAEAYLLGEIIPASYYLLKYHQKTKLRYLFLSSLFAALALMTKGLFTLITVSTGVIALFIYQKQYQNFVSIKWWSVVALTFIFAAPEFIALYTQFGSTGIKWFFIGSQFGRFFDNGRITQAHGGTLYYFLGVFLWSFLPWTLVFIAAVLHIVKNFKQQVLEQKQAVIYLLSIFVITFIMFSLSQFQFDYYIDIILPFAAILSAYYLGEQRQHAAKNPIFKIQLGIAMILLFLTLILIALAAIKANPYFMLFSMLPALLLLGMLFTWSKLSLFQKAISYSALTASILFFIGVAMQVILFAPLNAGYVIAQVVNQQGDHLPIYEFTQSSVSVYVQQPSMMVSSLDQLPKDSSYYLIVQDPEENVSAILQQFPHAKVILNQDFYHIGKFLGYVTWSEAKIRAEAQHTFLLKIN